MTPPAHRKLVFFIVDGCSAYYLDRLLAELPGFKAIVDNGVKAQYSKPIFPSLSMPNYYTMFTGLYAEDHGMFSNQIYDYAWKEKFHVSSHKIRDDWYAEAPEPLWVKTGRLGIRTSMYWPWFVNFKTQHSRGEFLHHGETYGTFLEKHGGDKTEFKSWIQSKWTELVELLKDPVDQFIIIYWGTTDELCHRFGPDSPEAMAELKLADGALANLQEQLNNAGLLSTVDLFVAADHGQMLAPKENHVHMDDYFGDLVINGDIEAHCDSDAYMLIYTVPGKENEVYEKIRARNIPHVSVVKNADLPERFRVKKARRAPPIWLLAAPGYSLVDGVNKGKHYLGVHGYDNECESMRGVCLGRGPGFSHNPPVMTEKPVSTLDYYSIMCQLLDIKE